MFPLIENCEGVCVKNLTINIHEIMNQTRQEQETIDYPYGELLPAILAIYNAVANSIYRGQVLMPTATGKTIVMAEAIRLCTEYLGINSIVMTGSTIELSLQHVRTIKEHINNADISSKFKSTKILLVCSDTERKEFEVDDIVQNITTDIEETINFINQNEKEGNSYVIVSTYHSLKNVVGAAFSNTEHSLDITFYDEAHNATNNQFSGTVYYEDEEGNIHTDVKEYQTKYSFFLTATPRETYREEEGEKKGTRKIGMDKEEIFGEVLYLMTPNEAIKKGMILSPKIVISQIKEGYESYVSKFCSFNTFSKTTYTEALEYELQTEAMLTYGGLLEVYKDAGKVKAIVYARSVDHARYLHENVNWAEMLGISGLRTSFVAAELTSRDRKMEMERFIEAENAIIFNYKVLSEGINIEDVNAVVCLRAMEDAVPLTQALGRPIRVDPRDRKRKFAEEISVDDKTTWYKPYGYIVIPETFGRSMHKDYVLERSVEFITTLCNIGFGDSLLVGWNLDNYGREFKGRLNKKAKEKFADNKYDIDYCKDVKSLAELFSKYGTINMYDIMNSFLEDEVEELKDTANGEMFEIS